MNRVPATSHGRCGTTLGAVAPPATEATTSDDRVKQWLATSNGSSSGTDAVRLAASASVSDAATAAAKAVGKSPSHCGPPTAPIAGLPETFKATDADALQQWLDPAYADKRQAEKLAAQMNLEIGKLAAEDHLRMLTLQAPDAVKQIAVLGPIVIPIAEATHEVALLTPIVGELVAGAEAITGRGLFGLGEKISDEERIINGIIAATLVAGPILESGARGARTIVEIARRTGKSTEQIVTALKVARQLKRDEPILREALALRKAGESLEPKHVAALKRAGEAVVEVGGGSVGAARRYQYELNPKHGPKKVGNISARPTNGQSALDNSVQIKERKATRIGIDYDTDEIVVLPEHRPEIFHGYVTTWDELDPVQQNALVRSGLTNRRGKILRGE